VSDLQASDWDRRVWRGESIPHEATLRLASALVQDGITRVTVIVPRAPGVLMRARIVAEGADVEVSAGQIASTSMTLCFSPRPAIDPRRAGVQNSTRRGTNRAWLWTRCRTWLCALRFGRLPGLP
jgi:hypothetical protein